jgi:hypothetical protein
MIKKLILYLCGIHSFIESHPWSSAVHSFMLRVIFHLCLVLPSCFFPLRFSNLAFVQIPYPLYTTYYVHLILLGLISLPAIRSVHNFCCPVLFLQALFSTYSQTSSVYFSFCRVRDQMTPILTLPMLCYLSVRSSVFQLHCCYLVPVSDLRWQEATFYCIKYSGWRNMTEFWTVAWNWIYINHCNIGRVN